MFRNPLNPLPTVMGHDFARVPKVEIPRSSFNRSHGHKTTFDAGYLIPIFCDEALPGDTFNLQMAGFGRLATPIFPLMDNMYLDTHFFAVPIRLVWENWQRFCGEQTDPGDTTDYVTPKITVPSIGFAEGSIFDYFGLPTKVNLDNVKVANGPVAFPLRAYNLIYNEWFRDQNLIDSVPVEVDDANDADTLYTLLRRGKRHDYFTSCLPFVQKGDPVVIPIGETANIHYAGLGSKAPNVYDVASGNFRDFVDSVANSTNAITLTASASVAGNKLYADLSTATAATINDLRQAFQVQRLLERDARGGTRYTEIIRSHFGVVSPDQRLQRPEYLGGGSSRINVTPVPQTSVTAATPQGNLAAYGTVAFNGHGFTKSFDEHCIVIGLVSIRADLTYQYGINRMWSRQTRYDYYWPSLAHLGEQAVLNKEIYAQGTAADDQVFGYQERYAEYRYKPSLITGLFRSNATSSLDSWHLCQEFASLPVLNKTFIEENPPIDRVIAVPSQPHMIFDSFFDLKCARPMPLYSVPGLIDHF